MRTTSATGPFSAFVAAVRVFVSVYSAAVPIKLYLVESQGNEFKGTLRDIGLEVSGKSATVETNN